MTEDDDPDLSAFARARNWRRLNDPDRKPAPVGLPFTRIITHAERGPDSVFDFAAERYIRANSGARMFYYGLLDRIAVANSPVARAASGEKVTERRLGGNVVKLLREDSGLYLVIEVSDPGSSGYEIEARDNQAEGVRVRVGAPIEGIISIRIDPRFPELEDLARLLEDPTSSLWLLRVLEGA